MNSHGTKNGGKGSGSVLKLEIGCKPSEGELEARDARMQEYLSQVRHLQSDFEFFDMSHVSRSGNTHTDSLATLATSSAQGLPRVILVEDLYRVDVVKEDMVRIH